MDVLSKQSTSDLFLEWGGIYSDEMKLPMLPSQAKVTPQGIPYLDDSGVVMLGRTIADLSGVKTFLSGFDKSLGFEKYLEDPTKLTDGSKLIKFAGQLCYMSMGEKRSWNKDASKYLDHIKSSGHGSVLEHANYNFLFWGISRSQTHEKVRHRAGVAFSQVSQRYVSGKVLRFILRPEYVGDEFLMRKFYERCERNYNDYHEIAEYLAAKQEKGDSQILSGDAKTELRKKVQQVSRSLLPNETEAPIVVTVNARAARHMKEMRAAGPAETEIRRAWFKLFLCLRQVDPEVFEDYEAVRLDDGTFAVQTKYRKV